ncbi:MAG: hypothetical protein EKK54_06185 [Neisseriaceae bacterium]|nr:MAG: hypothetical protein EKK54_06185 [Neisseriaceae bacterium]
MAHKYEEFYHLAIANNAGELILNTLENEKVKDIMLNENGCLFVDIVGDGFSKIGEMDPISAEAFLLSVAAYMGREFNYFYPRIRGTLPKELPFHGERIEAMTYPLVENPSFTIRKPLIKQYKLPEYVNRGQMTSVQLQAVDTGIRGKMTMLIIGGTGTGKTTFTNAVVQRITELDSAKKCRLYIMQDSREIVTDYENATFPIVTDTLGMSDLLESGMRYNPSRLIVGELIGKEVYTFLSALNTGHRGSISTIHADSVPEAMERIEELMQTHGFKMSPKEIASRIQMLIFLEVDKKSGLPMVKNIGLVKGYDVVNKQYMVDDKLYRN